MAYIWCWLTLPFSCSLYSPFSCFLTVFLLPWLYPPPPFDPAQSTSALFETMTEHSAVAYYVISWHGCPDASHNGSWDNRLSHRLGAVLRGRSQVGTQKSRGGASITFLFPWMDHWLSADLEPCNPINHILFNQINSDKVRKAIPAFISEIKYQG